MSVALCHRCGKLVSISVIPGGNPVAGSDPDHWATSYTQCKECGQVYCPKCAEMVPLCPECPGPPKPPSQAAQVACLQRICQKRHEYPDVELFRSVWGFTTPAHTLEGKISLLQDTFTRPEMQMFGQAALRLVDPSGEISGYGWHGALCWYPDTDKFIPYEFVALLAKFHQPDLPA